jgi:hypothetical protein
MSLIKEIKSPTSRVFRRAYIKRMLYSGEYESSWVEITNDIKKWGKISTKTDSVRLNQIQFSPVTMVMSNDEGKYNPADDDSSLWLGYPTQQRTLIKIEAGFVKQTLAASGIWINHEYPENGYWDVDLYDASLYDMDKKTIFKGFISGDLFRNQQNSITLPIKPLVELFRQYPARNLAGYTTTGLTASEFMESVRDHQDSGGNYIFRPFFDNTTSNWLISTTTVNYTQLSTSTANEVIDKNVWDVMSKLAESENYITYINNSGQFVFKSKDALTTTASFVFNGQGYFDTEYGHTIKSVKRYGTVFNKFYSRVQVKFNDSDTSTSYSVVESTMTVDGNNLAWTLGQKTYSIDNFYIPTATTAETIAQNVFNDYSSLKEEIEFNSSFVVGLDVFDTVTINYDTSPLSPESLWDQKYWADSIASSNDLIWDSYKSDAIRLSNVDFKILSYEIDLDNLGTSFVMRKA